MDVSPLFLREQGARRLQSRLCLFNLEFAMGPKTIVYVDGFNLYYGAVKGTPYKWLNLMALCESLLPKNKIVKIKYFTARVSARPGDPDQPNRQQIYLRALRTIPYLEIIYGHFLEHEVSMRLAHPPQGGSPYVYVIKTEEKGSDVNIAAHLINDGYKGRYQVAVVLSNDSDLVEPIKIVRRDLGLTVGVLNPHPKHPSRALKKFASFVKPIRKGALRSCQFPEQMRDEKGVFRRPLRW